MLRITTTAVAALLLLAPCTAQESAGIAGKGEVEIAFWVQGPKNSPVIMLVNGQGAATRVGGDGMVRAFVAEGYRVITFDNRDSGQSTLLRSARAPPETQEMRAALSGGEALRCDLVANALCRYLALELREGQENVEPQPAH